MPGAGRVRMTLSMWNKKSTYIGIMERENPEARPQGQACTLSSPAELAGDGGWNKEMA